MKKIINGKVYDTETASKLGVWQSHGDRRSFDYIREAIYRKKTGEFFLFGVGGPMTKYAAPEGSNSWSRGSRIMPMTFAEARKWAEEHLDGDEYEAIFGAVTEGESRMQVCYSLSVATAEIIKRRASEAGVSASAYIEQLVTAT